MDVQGLSLLVDIIEAGNLSRAAAALGTSRANVSQRLNRFERQLGVQLLRRTTRDLVPTEIGLKLYQHGLAMRHEVQAADEAVSGLGRGLQGSVRLSVPSGYGQLRMSAWLNEFMQLHPDIALHVIFNNDIEELVKGAVDFAVRVMAEPPPQLVAHRLGPVGYVACATAGLLDQHGRPTTLDALRQLPLIASSQTSERLRTAGIAGPNQRVPQIRFRLVSANFHCLLGAVSQGLGIGLMPDYMVQAEIDGGVLQPVPLEPGTLDFLATGKFLLHVPDRYQTLAVQTLIGFLIEKEKAQEGQAGVPQRRRGRAATIAP
ncbi:LysR family transcriptional regulator [Paracidovorax wautersii]|uniref:LysR family transcriptional regulator n=1 Tax=Paracidovorax wautersii TaxID=1177982 RepID=UPI0031D8C217